AVRADTGKVPRDTTPPPQLPEFPRPVPAGFSTGVWVFTRDSIERFATAVSLGDLLEMVPGIARVRAGYFVQPDGAMALGQTGGRTRVFLDGYELTSLDGGVPDLSRIELVNVSRIRVERRLDELLIELRSLSPSIAQPWEYVQAGVAEPGGKLFRGAFLAPNVALGPLSVGFERLDTDGYRGADPGSETAVWGKWGKIWRNRGGLQAEYRHSTVARDAGAATGAPWTGSFNRSDLMLRGRWQLVPGLVGEAYFGSSGTKDPRLVPDTIGFAVHSPLDTLRIPALNDSSTRADTLRADSLFRLKSDSTTERSDRQLGLRLGFLRGPLFGDAALRTHSASLLPGTEGDVTVGLAQAGLGDVDAGAHLESWTGKSLTDTRLRARIGPFRGLSVLAELASGQRGVPSLADSLGRTLVSDRKSWRAGADFDSEWLSGGIARVSVTQDSMPSLGLLYDFRARQYPGGSMTGWESHGRVRLFFKPLAAEFWYLAWTQFQLTQAAADFGLTQPLYVPQQQYRASLVYHQSPLASGHLELYARLDARSRGISYLPAAPTTPVLAVNTVDFYLQIRVLDLRMFFQESAFTTQKGTLTDFPASFGRIIPAPRIFYGIRWQFFN
ncbi:MAG TPA: Plug domain-containing protein, partial [Longimicrobiales bacterium]